MDEWTYAGYPNAGAYANAIVNGDVSDQQIAMNEYFSSPEGQIAGIVNKLQEQYRDYDNTWSAEQARIQREWSAQEAEKNRMFNMAEAAKNRAWQSEMSNSAHQREVNDLMAAGLNPVLSAMGGNGAAVGSGATAAGVGNPSGSAANGNQSAGMAVASMLGTILKNQNELELQRNNADLVHWQTEYAAQVNELLAHITGQYANRSASISAAGVLGAAETAAQASEHNSKRNFISSLAGTGASVLNNLVSSVGNLFGHFISADATKSAAETSAGATRYAADTTAEYQKTLKQMQLDYDNSHPSNAYGLGGSVLTYLYDAVNEMNRMGADSFKPGGFYNMIQDFKDAQKASDPDAAYLEVLSKFQNGYYTK